jgi:uncharacterized protein YndB with AHSA1/START domain
LVHRTYDIAGGLVLRALALSTLVGLCASAAHAAEIAANGFVVRHEVVIAAAPPKVYDALVDRVGGWWNSQHTYSGDSGNLTIDARPGGCFCERLASGGVEHMRVVHVRRNQLLRMYGGLGPLQGSGVAGAMTWTLSPAQDATKLELTYSVGGFIAGGFDAMAPAVERVLGEQVQRLKRFVETGVPDAPK